MRLDERLQTCPGHVRLDRRLEGIFRTSAMDRAPLKFLLTSGLYFFECDFAQRRGYPRFWKVFGHNMQMPPASIRRQWALRGLFSATQVPLCPCCHPCLTARYHFCTTHGRIPGPRCPTPTPAWHKQAVALPTPCCRRWALGRQLQCEG